MKKIVLFALAALIILSPNFVFAIDWTLPKQNLNLDPTISDFSTADSSSFIIDLDEPGRYISPVSENGILFFAEYHQLYLYSIVRAVSIHTGVELWSKQFPGKIYKIIANNNELYVGADKLYSLDSTNGNQVWSINFNSEGEEISQATPVSLVDDMLFLSLRTGSSSYLNIYDLSYDDFIGLALSYKDSSPEIMADEEKIFIVYSPNSTTSRVDAYSRKSFNFLWSSDNCADDTSYAMLDQMNDVIYLGSSAGRFCGYSTVSGNQLFKRFNSFHKGFATYGNRGYGFATPTYNKNSAYFRSFLLSQKDGIIPDQVTIMTGGEIFESSPVVVNSVLYGGTSEGRLWAKDMESIDAEFFQIDEDNFNIDKIIYASGKLVMTSYDKSGGTGARLYVYNQSDLDFENLNYEVELSSPYKTDGEYNAYLGQTHSHFVPEKGFEWWNDYCNGPALPSFTEELYRDAGYDFEALTEHNWIQKDPEVDGIMHIVDSEEDTQGEGGNHILALGIETPIREQDSEQERVDQIIDQGGYAILAHPNSKDYPWSIEKMFEVENYDAVEIYNHSTSRLDPFYYWGSSESVDKWDNLLSKRKLVWGTGGDDYTPGDGGFDGAGVVVFAKELTQEAIMQNLKDGNFYALQGSEAPRITVDVVDNQITVSSGKENEIQFIGKDGKVLQKTDDATSATYNVVGDEVYVRAQVTANRKSAWSQPIFVSRKLQKITSDEGSYYINLGQAKLVSRNSDQVVAKVLPIEDYPDTMPPLGYYSEIYSLYSQGDVYDGTKLAISYAGQNLLTSASNLSLYYYSEAESVWQKVESTIDYDNAVVYADLDHFSLYALSADEPEDLENPEVELISPGDFNDLSRNVEFEVLASDNNAVVGVEYYLDDKLIYADSDPSDGWIWPAELDNIAGGDYELSIEAFDLSGNIGKAKYIINVDSGLLKPTVNITNPTSDQNLEGIGQIIGTVRSQGNIDSVDIYLNELFIGEATLVGEEYNLDIDWDQFVEGNRALKVSATDIYGNLGETTVDINIGQSTEATITSPPEEEYLLNENINFSYETNSPKEVRAYLDDELIENGAEKYGFEVGLGEHIYKIVANDEVLDQKDFAITTNLYDSISLIMLLYSQGHIKKKGIRNSLIARFVLIDRFKKRGFDFVGDILERNTIRWISRQNDKKIDGYTKVLLTRCLVFS